MDEESQVTSHKGQKLKNYSLQFKLGAISFAAIHGNRAAERKYNVDRKRIREWRGKKYRKNCEEKESYRLPKTKGSKEVEENILMKNWTYMKDAVEACGHQENSL